MTHGSLFSGIGGSGSKYQDAMRIGLIDIDGHNYPNLALMKLSAWHKAQGDTVEWAQEFGHYDVLYKSKVFTFSTERTFFVSADRIVKGGTGYRDYETTLPEEIEHTCPDYSLYPEFRAAYGFLTRGCPNRCPWCVVPRKEGGIRPHADIGEFISDRKQAILLDNNVLASDFGLSQIEEIVRRGIRVDFNQGLDARIIAECPDIARLLAQVKWIRYIRMAYDHAANEEPVMRAIENLKAAGVKTYKMWFYVLVKDVPDAMRRVEQLRSAGCAPFAQPYRDFEHNIKPTKFQRDFAHWVNKKELFNSIEFQAFEPRKGFKCSQYFQ